MVGYHKYNSYRGSWYQQVQVHCHCGERFRRPVAGGPAVVDRLVDADHLVDVDRLVEAGRLVEANGLVEADRFGDEPMAELEEGVDVLSSIQCT